VFLNANSRKSTTLIIAVEEFLQVEIIHVNMAEMKLTLILVLPEF